MPRRWPCRQAEEIAGEVTGWIAPHCTRTLVVGEVRRHLHAVAELDILAMPRGQAGRDGLVRTLVDLSLRELVHIRENTPERVRMVSLETGLPVHIYLVEDVAVWANRMVELTGPSRFVTELHRAARALRWEWMPAAGGIQKRGRLQPYLSEGGVLQALIGRRPRPEARE